MVTLPAVTYSAPLWDFNHAISIHACLKNLLNVPFNPPAAYLHALSGVKPLNVSYTRSRLQLLRQLVQSGLWEESILSQRGPLVAAIKTDMVGFLGRKFPAHSLGIDNVTRGAVKKFEQVKWEKSWRSFERTQDCKIGLTLSLPSMFLLTNPIPLDGSRISIGLLCSIVSGHCSLQEFSYKLGLTFSPSCVCLSVDESVDHFLFDCPIFILVCGLP